MRGYNIGVNNIYKVFHMEQGKPNYHQPIVYVKYIISMEAYE